ncbi:4Fe-4S dicluster domain-containing protein [Helicobacter sp. 12S02634-8]|uniref:4Fe-4S dicluster domain-containing protein n=1 Tax=Helicobacter sp. 12S02634-8 TaxID=1476199 RepID=UPI00155337AB|nr:4Fe-4S dicluster domain-containing protein [Helicobacter sp. 12S02634-8]
MLCKDCAGDCVEACPMEIVIKTEGGVPYLDFSSAGCVFCKKCAEVCWEKYGQDSVLDPCLQGDIQAYAHIDVLNCLAYHQVVCASCKDVCNGAIAFSGLFYPEVLEACNGCGMCVRVCPQNAIKIEPKQAKTQAQANRGQANRVQAR